MELQRECSKWKRRNGQTKSGTMNYLLKSGCIWSLKWYHWVYSVVLLCAISNMRWTSISDNSYENWTLFCVCVIFVCGWLFALWVLFWVVCVRLIKEWVGMSFFYACGIGCVLICKTCCRNCHFGKCFHKMRFLLRIWCMLCWISNMVSMHSQCLTFLR